MGNNRWRCLSSYVEDKTAGCVLDPPVPDRYSSRNAGYTKPNRTHHCCVASRVLDRRTGAVVCSFSTQDCPTLGKQDCHCCVRYFDGLYGWAGDSSSTGFERGGAPCLRHRLRT